MASQSLVAKFSTLALGKCDANIFVAVEELVIGLSSLGHVSKVMKRCISQGLRQLSSDKKTESSSHVLTGGTAPNMRTCPKMFAGGS